MNVVLYPNPPARADATIIKEYAKEFRATLLNLVVQVSAEN